MAAEDARPKCKCHDEPMLANGWRTRKSGVRRREFSCARKRRAHSKRTHEALTGLKRSKRILQMYFARMRYVERRETR